MSDEARLADLRQQLTDINVRLGELYKREPPEPNWHMTAATAVFNTWPFAIALAVLYASRSQDQERAVNILWLSILVPIGLGVVLVKFPVPKTAAQKEFSRQWRPLSAELNSVFNEIQVIEQRQRRSAWLENQSRAHRLSAPKPVRDDPITEYQGYLSSPEWKEIAWQVRERAGYRCQICNKRERLDVHHRTYERFGDEDLDDLIALCRDCHALYHEK